MMHPFVLSSAVLAAAAWFFAPVASRAADVDRTALVWQPVDLILRAAESYPWWEFPVQAEFRQEGTGATLAIDGCWDGADRWLVRFAAPAAGTWTWRTRSRDRGLDGRTGRLVARAAAPDEVARNANLRGAVRVRPGERHFSYADGTPLFLLADTLWAASTARCGLGERDDGPFFQYLADRQAKGFNAVLLQYFHGYGDYPDAPGHRNEGGQAFADDAVTQLNPAFFAALDRRMRALGERGFVAAVPTTWWGKTKRNRFTLETALRTTAYCAVRYGAFNALWSLSGEYQYAFKDCGWTAADFSALGALIQRHNPYGRPVSIHPSAQLNWPPPHHEQSSRAFHGEPWLDHHWLQTGQSRDRMFNIVGRLAADRALAPAMPVFCSEAFYEVAADPDSAYHARWQAWVALLNGAAGYGYGAQGLWQFHDPADPHGEPGKITREIVPWRQALALPGSSQLAPVRQLLGTLPWWQLAPARDRLRLDGVASGPPTPRDLTPPHAAVGDDTAIVYLPRGLAPKQIELALATGTWTARWFDPRTGAFAGGATALPPGGGGVTLPARPTPADEDWVLLFRRGR